jgi:hypothetical protein
MGSSLLRLEAPCSTDGMKSRRVLSSVIALAIVALALPSQAQERNSGAAAPPAPEVLPPPGTGGSGPAEPAPARPVTPAAGYAYGDKQTASTRGSAPHAHYRRSGPVVNMPGFEQTGDGGSRLFVQLSQNVPVEERKAQGVITYVLKGASPRVWNNTNALVTVHFNTPVSRARLVPQGQDLLFIIELRAAAAPTWKMTEAPDKTATLLIDFPKGEYLPTGGGEVTAPAPAGATAPSPVPAHAAARPAPKGVRGGKRPVAKPAKAEPSPASAAKP